MMSAPASVAFTPSIARSSEAPCETPLVLWSSVDAMVR